MSCDINGLSKAKLSSLYLLLLLAALRPAPLAAQTLEWMRQFGSGVNDDARAVASDGSGAYLTGATTGVLPGQSAVGGRDAYVRKYDLNGNEVWTRQFGTTSSDEAHGVAVSASGVYVVGATNGTFAGQSSAGGQDVFIRKYDLNGTVLWTRQFGSSNSDAALAAAADSSGVYVAGTTFGTLPDQTNVGQEDAFLRKYDPDGNILWTRQFGTAGSEANTAVAPDSSAVYVSGTTDGAFAGQTDGPFSDVYVRRYDLNGGEVWTRQFGSTGSFASDAAAGVAVDATGIYVAGLTQGALPGQSLVGIEDAFVRKYDANGTEVWTRQFGAAGTFSGAAGVGLAPAGVYVGGVTDGTLPGQTSAGQEDGYVRRYDTNGTPVWTSQFGSTNSDFLFGVTAGSTGTYVAGETFGTLPGQSSAGGQDAFAAKFAPESFVCSYSLTPTSQAFPAAGGMSSVAVNTQDGCAWTAASNAAFVSITSGASGSGPGTVNYTVEAHAGASPRSGTMTIAGETFTVDQAVTVCSYSINPASQNFPAAGGIGGITVTATTGCPWTAVSNAAFVQITAGSSGNGNGVVSFTVAANPNTTGRAGTLTVAALTFTVTQDGTAPPPPTAPVVFEGGVVNNASFAASPAPVAPGSIAAVFGQNLNAGSTLWFSNFGQDGKLVTSLGGATVAINGIPAPLFYSTPQQLGIQIPVQLAGQASAIIVVTVAGESSAPRSLNLAEHAPGIFTVNQQGSGIASVLHENGGAQVTVANPAQPGELLTFFMTGLGPLTPPLETGAPSAGNQTAAASTVTIDGVQAGVEYSGSAAGTVGLNQVRVRVPVGTRAAPDIPVVLRIGGQTSNPATIPVGP